MHRKEKGEALIRTLSDLTVAAHWVIEQMGSSRIVCFYGPMGAGKTTLIKAVCHELGVADTVVSPTFALVNEYAARGSVPIYHFDFYRVERVDEVYDFGYEEYFYSPAGICLIEWPEIVEALLPLEGVVRVRIEVQPGGERRVTL